MAVSVSQQQQQVQQPYPVLWSLRPTFSASAEIMPTSVGGPMPTQSRQGRHMQRYGNDGDRLVAGCIPVRFAGEGCRPEDVQVLMISSSSGGKGLVFPKGGWEDDETVEMAALRETVEEAGVRGVLEEPLLGHFKFNCSKTDREGRQHSCCTAYMFVMHVAEELETWPEGTERLRRWCSLKEASHSCRHAWMRDALHVWIQRRGWQVPVVFAESSSSDHLPVTHSSCDAMSSSDTSCCPA